MSEEPYYLVHQGTPLRLCLGKGNTNPLTYATFDKAQGVADENTGRIWKWRDMVPISVAEYTQKYGAVQ